jgi:hypothetical protein
MYLFASIYHLTIQLAMFRRSSQHPCQPANVQYSICIHSSTIHISHILVMEYPMKDVLVPNHMHYKGRLDDNTKDEPAKLV